MPESTEIQFYGLIVAVIALLAGITFNLINRYYQKKQLQLNTLFKVIELFSSSEIRDARKTVYDEYFKLKKENKPIIFNRSAFIQQQADKVKKSFEQVAVLINEKLVDEKLFFRIYGGIVVRSWNALEQDIMNDRKKNPVYCEDYKKLKEKFEKHYTAENMPKPYQRELESS